MNKLMISNDIYYITYTSISAIYKKSIQKKNNGNKNNKKHFHNKNERRCSDVKTQKACEQGWVANIGRKIKHITLHKYSSLLYSCVSTYVGLYV